MSKKRSNSNALQVDWQAIHLYLNHIKPGLTIEYNGDEVYVQKSTGADYLYEILSHPYRYIAAEELTALYSNGHGKEDAGSMLDLEKTGMQTGGRSTQPVMDWKGIREIKQRLVWLNERCAELMAWNDHSALNDLLEEREALISYLSRALGLSNRLRPLDEEAHKVVACANKSIRRALSQICKQNPSLGAALLASLRLGRYLGFFPQ